jgi:Mlc titration factor MtfA (ptsG expression regulator)
MHKIEAGKSDINPYALTNEAEFLAVVSEYFFEKPEQLQHKHPELYEILSLIFTQDPAKNSL